MRYRKIIAITLSMILFMNPMTVFAKSTELTEKQKETASKVAEVVSGKWEEYGVLPSVAVAQTFVESSLGVNQVRPNNLWGLRPGGEYSSYRNLNDGIHAYLKILNNGLYDNALYKKEYEVQLQKILEGGYYGEDDGGTIEEYYKDCVDSIRDYHFEQYDKKLFKRLRKKEEHKRMKKWDKTYTIVYDNSVGEHEVMVDKKIIKSGVVQIWKKKELQGIYDAVLGQKGRKIGISNQELDGMKVKIEVNEEAKG